MALAWTLICFVSSAAMIWVSYGRLRGVRAATLSAAPHLSRSRHAPGTDTEQERRIRVAALNEATLDIRVQVERPGYVPRSCAKASFSLGAAVALMQAIRSGQAGESAAWLLPALSVVGGSLGAVGCWLIGRTAEQEASRLRADWNALIRRSTRDVAG